MAMLKRIGGGGGHAGTWDMGNRRRTRGRGTHTHTHTHTRPVPQQHRGCAGGAPSTHVSGGMPHNGAHTAPLLRRGVRVHPRRGSRGGGGGGWRPCSSAARIPGSRTGTRGAAAVGGGRVRTAARPDMGRWTTGGRWGAGHGPPRTAQDKDHNPQTHCQAKDNATAGPQNGHNHKPPPQHVSARRPHKTHWSQGHKAVGWSTKAPGAPAITTLSASSSLRTAVQRNNDTEGEGTQTWSWPLTR